MNTTVNTGELIKAYFDQKRIRKAALSRLMGKKLKAILQYEKNTTIQTRILWDLSVALQHNFFMDIAMVLPKEYSTNDDLFKEKNDRIKELERDVELLTKEKELLMEVLKK
jgi:hypothetical protein